MPTLKDDSTSAEKHSSINRPLPLWRNRDYVLLWSGQTISLVGTGVSQLAFPLLVLLLTGSPAQAGLVGALRALPYLIFSLPAGAFIDRWDRKRAMIFCDAGRALSLASIPLALSIGHLTLIQLYLVSFIEGTLYVFFNIAQAACLPQVVPSEQLAAATAQDQATTSGSFLLGPSLGGVLYSIGRAVPFFFDAVSYAISVISLLFIKVKFQGNRSRATRKLHVEIGEGLVWLWHQPLIRYMALLTGGSNLLAGETLIVIVIAHQQQASPSLIGLILGIAGIGGILGALLGPLIQKHFSFGQAVIGICWLYALLVPLYAVVPTPLALAVVAAASFTTFPIYNVVQISYRLALIPDELQGRVNSIFRLIAFSSIPLGQALTGILLQRFGVVPTVLLFSGWLVALAIVTTLNAHVRNARLPEKAHTS